MRPPVTSLSLSLALALALTAAISSPALATSVQVLPLDEMARRAAVIVEATVVDVRVEHERTKRGAGPATYTTLRVDDAHEGARAGELLVVYQPGAVGGAWVPGQRAYRAGERVVFFGVRHLRRVEGAPPLDVVVHLTLGYGTFDVDDAGAVRELVLDVADARTGRAPSARVFATRAAFRAALTGVRP